MGTLAMDNAPQHDYAKKVLRGQVDAVDPALLAQVPFFNQIEYGPLPKHRLPNFPIQIPYFHGDAIVHTNGVCHADKHAASQMRSQIRTIYYGDLWVDPRYQLELGLSPVGLVNPDVQSDKQQAMFNNPYTLVLDPDSAVLEVAWMLEGVLVFNAILAMASASVLHRQLTLAMSAEDAFTAWTALDIGTMMARQPLPLDPHGGYRGVPIAY